MSRKRGEIMPPASQESKTTAAFWADTVMLARAGDREALRTAIEGFCEAVGRAPNQDRRQDPPPELMKLIADLLDRTLAGEDPFVLRERGAPETGRALRYARAVVRCRVAARAQGERLTIDKAFDAVARHLCVSRSTVRKAYATYGKQARLIEGEKPKTSR